jgi:hypothetical protein
VAPGGVAGGTYTATVTGGTCSACDLFITEFPVSGGTASFDKKDTTGSGTGAISTPTLVPAGTGELYVAHASNAASVVGVTGAWTLGPDGVSANGDAMEYKLSVSASDSVGFTGTGGATFDSSIVAYSFTASGGGGSTLGNIQSVTGTGRIKSTAGTGLIRAF